MKLNTKEALKKNDHHLPHSVLKKPVTEDAENHESAARAQPDQPEDCYLKDLFDQINSLMSKKPEEIENANEGNYNKWLFDTYIFRDSLLILSCDS